MSKHPGHTPKASGINPGTFFNGLVRGKSGIKIENPGTTADDVSAYQENINSVYRSLNVTAYLRIYVSKNIQCLTFFKISLRMKKYS